MSVSDNTHSPRADQAAAPQAAKLPGVEPDRVPKDDLTSDAQFDPMKPARRVTRETRKPFGTLDQKLAYPSRPGYHRHWFTDKPGRITQAREAGYEHVTDPHTGKMVSRVVGKDKKGDAEIGYLMEIPQEWYEEDVAQTQKRVDQSDSAIRRGEANRGEDDGRYIPAQGITVKDTRATAPRESR